jgi:dihydroorotate dehydrogenase
VLALARIAQEAGADGLTCSNTAPVIERGLSTGSGGLSGRALRAWTPANVREVRRATERSLPINASGGILTPADALRCIEAGATTVQVYTGLVYRGPGIVGELTAGLASAIRSRRVELASLVGTA